MFSSMNESPMTAIITVMKTTIGSVFERPWRSTAARLCFTGVITTRLSTGIAFDSCSLSRYSRNASVSRCSSSTARAGVAAITCSWISGSGGEFVERSFDRTGYAAMCSRLSSIGPILTRLSCTPSPVASRA